MINALYLTGYSPFGMQISERSQSAPNLNYRYGFNEYEKENELSESGDCLDFGARIYNSQLGKFFTPDPVIYEFWSPYQYDANSPISTKDVFGMGPSSNLRYRDYFTPPDEPQEYTNRLTARGVWKRIWNKEYWGKDGLESMKKACNNNPDNGWFKSVRSMTVTHVAFKVQVVKQKESRTSDSPVITFTSNLPPQPAQSVWRLFWFAVKLHIVGAKDIHFTFYSPYGPNAVNPNVGQINRIWTTAVLSWKMAYYIRLGLDVTGYNVVYNSGGIGRQGTNETVTYTVTKRRLTLTTEYTSETVRYWGWRQWLANMKYRYFHSKLP